MKTSRGLLNRNAMSRLGKALPFAYMFLACIVLISALNAAFPKVASSKQSENDGTGHLVTDPSMRRSELGSDARKHAHSNSAAVSANETFDGTWPFEANYSSAPNFNMHYVDEGSGDETLLLLHGEPTWGYLFRQQILHWSKHARVVAVDHMGFGKSEAPQDRSYWLQDHVDNLEALVLELDLSGITLVMHDFGGPVGMGLAVRHPDRIKRIVSINAPLPFGQSDLIDRVTATAAMAVEH